MAERLLTADGVRRSFEVHGREVVGLPPTSLEVHAGDALAVTGPSGTGKSTLVSILAGWDAPTAGTVDRHAATVFVPQRVALIETLSVLENIAAADQDRPADLRDLAAALAVDHLLDRFPTEISLGERQRVGIARALHARAAVTILDEPTAHQDAGHTDLVLAAVTPPEGRAVVVATHDPLVVAWATAVVELVPHRELAAED